MVNMKNNIFENLGLKDGTNSMTPKQVEQLGTILPNQNTINVLEFGAGKTTMLLYNALKTKYTQVKYVTYETNSDYAPNTPGIEVRMHTKKELIEGNILINKDETYDLVIVDGPDGELRKYWYPLFAKNVKKGTIIHIDDAFHFESFETEFIKYFPQTKYLYEHKREFLHNRTGSNKCWITAKII
jgi:predicted O-methyltransferase YrrM